MHTPERIFATLNAFQTTRALEAAIKLNIFTAIDDSANSVPAIAKVCEAPERSTRILLDYLVIIQFLVKSSGRYSLTEESKIFLSRKSPAYLGSMIGFLNHETLMRGFDELASVVRRGGTELAGGGTVEDENPVWVDFAKAMAPMMVPAAGAIAKLLEFPKDRSLKVLDLAAGHGVFGIEIAKQFPNAEITALDWSSVLAVAKENAEKAKVGDRYKLVPGSAFDVAFPEKYDVILITNFLHHFDVPTCTSFLKKVNAALAPGGKAVTLEFVPNDDRISPPAEAAFSLIMLATTPSGDAYPFRELQGMFEAAGFMNNELHALVDAPQHVIVSSKE